MSDPVAYLITWTCYGTWLHGDSRGSVDDAHNARGTPVLPESVRQQVANARRMKGDAVRFDRRAREIVRQAIEAHCRLREWELMAVNVRSNHVHVVIGFGGERPEKMIREFKAWSTRRLREAGVVGLCDAVWTKHGSTRYIWESRSIAATVAYVEEGQDVGR